MYTFLKDHQLSIMLILIGVCGIMSLFVLISKSMSKRKKASLAMIELCSMFLLMFDRWAYIFRGDVTKLGYVMVRLSNFMVFALTLLIIGSVAFYIVELLKQDCEIQRTHKRMTASFILCGVGIVLLIISQFTGLYYTFDVSNHYRRSSGYVLCLLIPFVLFIIELSVVIQYRKKISRGLWISLVLFCVAPLVSSIVQTFVYGISLTDLTIITMAIVLFVFAYSDMNNQLEKMHKQEIDYLKRAESSMSKLFEQTTTTLVNAMDEGNNHHREHSFRVANYARRIAQNAGKTQHECEEVYFSALLHDVGKISLPESILTKKTELTDQEEELFRNHTIEGERIVSQISDYSYLGKAIRSHHERYDGQGYPDHLKGEEIPEIARIIAVADAYDDMTNLSSIRNQLPQARVREEFVKSSGTRFDPKFSKIMLKMIGDDTDYLMRETGVEQENTYKKNVHCSSYRSDISTGVEVTKELTIIRCKVKKYPDAAYSLPALILYDSLDGAVHTTQKAIDENSYTEYGELWFDGHSVCTHARVFDSNISEEVPVGELPEGEYVIEADRLRDHTRIRILGDGKIIEAIAVLPDSTRYAYIGLTGEHCDITDIRIEKTDRTVEEGDIPRIAREVDYLTRLESDIKNVQIDRYRSQATTGIPVKDGMRIEFHTMSLPTAHLIWHCPYVLLYTSDDETVNGPNFREFVLIRLDGEVEGEDPGAENKMQIIKSEDFDGWDTWNELNKIGFECKVEFKRLGNKITVTTENFGISIKNTTILSRDIKNVYVALTGDQVALTDIRIYD